ncbi:MAG: DNA polymerase IV [Nitrososphaerota archaeon]
MKVVACLDLDYFFAQAEELRRPEIRGKPVVVCVYSGRTEVSGAVASANYLARSYGVKAGMPISRAMRLLEGKDAVFLPVDKRYYSELSARVFEVVGRFDVTVEVVSVDEAFIDLTRVTSGDFGRASEVAASIKREVLLETGLRCTVGVGPNKVVAKIACDRAKPDGLLVVSPEQVRSFLSDLPVEEMPYVGRKVGEKLREMGITTIGQLASADPQVLVARFGEAMGRYLHLASRGEYDEPVAPREGRTQLSRIVTLKRDTSDPREVLSQLEGPMRALLDEARRQGYLCRGVGVIAITTDLRTLTRSRKLGSPVEDLEALRRNVSALLEELLGGTGGIRLRRAGVKLFDLERASGQRTLGEFLGSG